MKKAFLIFYLLAGSMLAIAQGFDMAELKKDLHSHSRHDTARVNRLNVLAEWYSLPIDERKNYADEAVTISQKIKYENGLGFAYAHLGNIERVLGHAEEGKTMLHLADSIATVSGDLKLKGIIAYNLAFTKSNNSVRDSLLESALDIARQAEDLDLQGGVLTAIANREKDPQRQADLFQQADSILEKAGNQYLRSTTILSASYYTNDPGEKKALYLKVLSLAEETGNPSFRILLLRYVASNLRLSDSKDALHYYFEAKKIAEESDDKQALSSIQNDIGYYFQMIDNDYALAMEYFLRGLHIAEEINEPEPLIRSWLGLGSLYSSMQDHENALMYLLKAEEMSKDLNDRILERSIQNTLGESYRQAGKYPEAISAYNKAINVYADLSTFDDHMNYGNLADTYTRMDSLSLAFQYGFRSLEGARQANDRYIESWVDAVLSRAYLKREMVDSAIYYGEAGLIAGKEIGTIELLRDNTLALANAYAEKKDFEKAYTNHLLYLTYRDSMMNAEVQNRTAVQKFNFNLDKKEAEISVLHEQKKGQRNLLMGSLVLLFLILAIAGLLLRNNRQKHKANRLLKKQKEEIDDKARELSVQKDNVELLSDIGRKITSSLSIENIIGTAYNNVNTLMDANVFGIGIYNAETKRIEFPATHEGGKPLPFYSYDVEDKNRFGAICFSRGEEITINDLHEEYGDHINEMPTPYEGGQTLSIVFLPLVSKGKKLGVITVQSFKMNAYSDYQIFMFRNIATYAAIAIENAESYETLNHTFSTLKETQAQLIQSEKMASLGELTAGIAHEIQNPLNFVNNFSELSNELLTELLEELKTGDTEQVNSLAADISENLKKINHHGTRADSIVKGMLQHSRINTGAKEPTDINALVDEYLRLSFHGMRAKDKSFNAKIETDFSDLMDKIHVVPQDIGRVLLNLFNNAFYAVHERAQSKTGDFQPTVSVITKSSGGQIDIRVKDNGNGIPQNIRDKIFQPFITTKPSGQGTGLGLSLSYDIVKAHGGKLTVVTAMGESTEFTVALPLTKTTQAPMPS